MLTKMMTKKNVSATRKTGSPCSLAAVGVVPRQITHVNRVTLYGNPPSLPSRVTLFQNGNLDSNPCNTHQIPNELFWVTHVR